MQNATKVGSVILRWHMNATIDTCIQIGIEIKCSLNDAPSLVHAIRMNDARMQSISMLIETCPKTNHQKLANKREKEMGVRRHALHTRTLITKFALSTEGLNE